jgi:type I restriction enzyme S subunit
VSAAGGAFAVRFGELERWDPASFHGIVWHWPALVMAPIGSVLRLRREKADRALYDFTSLQPITIHFDGSIDRREVQAGREYTMDLQFARPGDVVVAKIDLKNGAVGLVPDWENVVVTNHFAVYEPDRPRLVPEYFALLIQTSFFKAYLWRNKVGAEGRKEVKLDFFESIAIPLPPLETQRAIVARWQAAQIEADAAEARVEQVEAETDSHCYAILALETPTRGHKSKAFVAHWRGFSRWSVSFNQATETGNLTRGKYPVVALGSILDMVQYGTSEKANSSGNGTPVVRMNNIVDGSLDFSDLKYVDLPPNERKRLVLQDGDILFNRTNSKELVGKCAVFHEREEYVFASYLIRVRSQPSKATPDFLVRIINSPIGRQQINALSRQIIGQANVNSVELRSLQIPLPPLDIQRAIVERIQAGRAEIARLRAEAEHVRRAARAEVEALILGTLPVAGN